MSNSIKFPEGFLWGGATSAGQYEGGADEGGCGLSHMDYIRYLPRKEGMLTPKRIPGLSIVWQKLPAVSCFPIKNILKKQRL